MPRLSERVWQQRRCHVLHSAFRCFARSGFHATVIDDVIAESGLSSSVVYRYVPGGKDELIAAAVQETLDQLSLLVDGLVAGDPVPTPREAVEAVMANFDDEAHGRAYHLAGLVLQLWAEALRTPEIAARARDTWDQARRRLTDLAQRWHDLGLLPPGQRPQDVAATMSLMAMGILVDVTHLGGDATRDALSQLQQLAR